MKLETRLQKIEDDLRSASERRNIIAPVREALHDAIDAVVAAQREMNDPENHRKYRKTNKAERDFADLIAALWQRDYEITSTFIKSRWIDREVQEAAYKEGLFKGWLTKKQDSLAWKGPEESRKFRKLCEQFNGSLIEHYDIYERVRFEVQGEGHERCYILRNER